MANFKRLRQVLYKTEGWLTDDFTGPTAPAKYSPGFISAAVMLTRKPDILMDGFLGFPLARFDAYQVMLCWQGTYQGNLLSFDRFGGVPLLFSFPQCAVRITLNARNSRVFNTAVREGRGHHRHRKRGLR